MNKEFEMTEFFNWRGKNGKDCVAAYVDGKIALYFGENDARTMLFMNKREARKLVKILVSIMDMENVR